MNVFDDLRQKNLDLTKKKIRESVSKDQMIIHAINNIEELEKSINVLSGRIREWFELEDPELSYRLSDNEKFVQTIFEYDGSDTIMGLRLEKEDDLALKGLAASIIGLIKTKEFLILYLEKTMSVVCPNVLKLAGVTIGAKLLRGAKSMKRLAFLQSSTIQLLGAETALFKHIRSGSRPPKYGYIFNHPLLINAIRRDRGKVARALANKISVCARLDYFKGEFLADNILQELKKKWNK